MTISPLVFVLSVQSTLEGKNLIKYFSDMLGEPALQYHDQMPDGSIDDYTAQWHFFNDPQTKLRIIEQHLKMGFTTSEIKEEE
jgi:hypothetical protein